MTPVRATRGLPLRDLAVGPSSQPQPAVLPRHQNALERRPWHPVARTAHLLVFSWARNLASRDSGEKLCESYDFEASARSLGMLMTADGSDDNLIKRCRVCRGPTPSATQTAAVRVPRAMPTSDEGEDEEADVEAGEEEGEDEDEADGGRHGGRPVGVW